MAAPAHAAPGNAAVTWMTWAAAIFVVVGSLAMLRLLRVGARVAEVAQEVRGAVSVVRDATRSDADKGRALRGSAARLVVLAGGLVALTGVALAVPVGTVELLDLADVVRIGAVLELTLRPDFLLAALVLAIVLHAVRGPLARRAKRPLA